MSELNDPKFEPKLAPDLALETDPIYYPTIADIVGKTPLIRLQRIPGQGNQIRNNIILGKLEGNNPAGSVKDRPALSMIKKAQERI